IDDVTVRPQLSEKSAPVNFVRLAGFDPGILGGGTHLRVSFRNLADHGVNPDLKIGVFCTDDVDAEAFVVNDVSFVETDGGQWYWSRIATPQVERLEHCSSPNLRLYPTQGALPSTSTLGELSILKVITPDVRGNHHTLPGGAG